MPPATIDWAGITAKLPTSFSAEEKAARMALFKQFDPNNNGFLSLAEVDKGLRESLGLDAIFDAKPVIIRAFTAAKSLDNKSGAASRGDDCVQKKEFRMLLVYLACYLRIYEVFTSADSSGDRRLSKDEFFGVVPKLKQWLGDATPEELWAKFNSDGGQVVLFADFAEQTIKAVMERDNPEAE